MTYVAVFSVFILIQVIVRYRKTGSLYPAVYLSEKHKAYLERYFVFYQKLPPVSQGVFRKRVATFISSKKFIPRNMEYVTSEMKVLISASAIQLTFGFPKVNLSYFNNILVYPDSYYSVINRTHHKGEVNPRFRAIVLSWKYFVEGYLKPDGRNLGLHEMAHALRLENRILNQEYNFLDENILKEWELRAEYTMQEIRDGQEDFFREYGAVDNEEFFSVAVENFFERPKTFFEKHPKTYTTLCRLLRQDPILLS
ncbi:MAG: zinc-dependent peptidase [Cyclobacteriaceae bacterium]